MPSDFLISFNRKHFPDEDVPIYSKKMFYKLVEEINKSRRVEGDD